MPWLDRINDRETRRIARNLVRSGTQMRDVAQDRLQHLTHQAGGMADDQFRHFAHQAGTFAGAAGHQLADYGRHEGAVLAQAAAKQAVRAGRAVRADPLPAIVGAVGLALFASLLMNRRRG